MISFYSGSLIFFFLFLFLLSLFFFSLVLSPPTDRFRADDLLQDSREDCYLSTLHIHHATEHDARPYYLVVENERGTDRHAIQLNVEGTFTGAEKSCFFILSVSLSLLNVCRLTFYVCVCLLMPVYVYASSAML